MDFSPEFLEGAECTGIFQLSCQDGNESCNFTKLNLNEFNDNGTTIPGLLNLFLSIPPAQDGMYSFRVECYVSGEGVELSTHETKEVFISN